MIERSLLPVDVVIVNFNAGGWLLRCVESVLAVASSITIVDNASSDGSLSTIESYQQSGRVNVLRNSVNIGFASAANQAANQNEVAKQAAEVDSAEYLLVLNPDCVLAEGALEALVNALQSSPKVGIAGPLVINPDGSEQRACRRRTPSPRRSVISMLGLERLGLHGVNIRGDLPSEAIELEAISGAALLFKRECWQQLGGYDENYFLHCEDLDLFYRAGQSGWKVLFVPAARVAHQQGVSQTGLPLTSARHKHRGMLRYYRKFFAGQTGALWRWIWPALIWLHFAVIAPLLWCRQWRAQQRCQ